MESSAQIIVTLLTFSGLAGMTVFIVGTAYPTVKEAFSSKSKADKLQAKYDASVEAGDIVSTWKIWKEILRREESEGKERVCK